MHSVPGRDVLEGLEADLSSVRRSMLEAEALRTDDIAATHPAHRRSALNLIHYLELRRHDVRDLQARLTSVGLSSLGRSEAHVLATIEAVHGLLAGLTGNEAPPPTATVALGEGHRILARNADQLLGTPSMPRTTRIMVTLPSEAAADADLVTRMTASGMDIARINCAHDDADAWTAMIDQVRATVRPHGHRPQIAMDLAGPKVRTGPMQPGPRALRISPRRDRLGVVTEPALIVLAVDGGGVALPRRARFVAIADAEWLGRRQIGDRIELIDSRGATREWDVVETSAQCCVASATQTAYVTVGLTLTCPSAGGDDVTTVGSLPETVQSHQVEVGDHIALTCSLEPAAPTADGDPHRIGCTLSEVFTQARPGERVWLDDGKIGGTIERVDADTIVLVVTDARPGGAKLKAGKGINFPDTHLSLDALTAKDLDDLDFVAGHADMVNLSFVRHPKDVERLQQELDRREADDVGIVLKIENAAAFDHLPELLLTAMRSRKFGVMIARGDLAVEVGFERLAEVQEEIMWACEAAHAPVIWATQVLDTLARTGQPSRAEITDAATSDRAECVMLNKGPYIVEAIQTLDSILSRMQHHQDKKQSLLRRLNAWDSSPDE